MAEGPKTVATEGSVEAFLAGVEPAQRREDALAVRDLMASVSGEQAVLWGPSIVGFGRRSYALAGGRTGETMRVGFSPRATSLALYVGVGDEAVAALLPGLGTHRTGKGCLYVRRLAEVDAGVLEAIVRTAWAGR